VGRAQQRLDGRVVARLSAGPDLVHQGFEDMGEADQGVQTKGAGSALHRMDGAEHGVDRLVVGRAALDRQQAGFEIAQQFITLLEEGDLDRLERIVAHDQAATRRTASISLTGSNGLTIQPVAPASRARCFLAASLSVVSTRTGVARCSGLARMPSIKPKPSRRGMLMSVMTTSAPSADRVSRPSMPSTAWITR